MDEVVQILSLLTIKDGVNVCLSQLNWQNFVVFVFMVQSESKSSGIFFVF